MEIINYAIKTSSGTLSKFGQQLDFLNPEQLKEFNTIGYTGKNSQGVKMSRVEYLNSLNPSVEQFNMTQTKYDNGDFNEAFILTRVII